MLDLADCLGFFKFPVAMSGMATGGRVQHHLRHNLWRSASSIVFVGYAAQGTPARRIIDGAREIDLFGEPVSVRAHVHTINGFSAHADQQELVDWRAGIGGVETTFIVHGDEAAMKALVGRLGAGHIEMPQLHSSFTL